MIEISNLSFNYDKQILNDLSCVFDDNDIISILGNNGSGKTTLLKCLLGINKTNKMIKINNQYIEDIKNIGKLISYVSQSKETNNHLLVKDTIMLGRSPYMTWFSIPSSNDYKVVKEMMEKCHITHLKDKTCDTLSGGEYQMVLICKALVQQTPIVILDEMESGLDYAHQYQFLNLIKELNKQGKLIIFTTHYPEHALNISNKCLLLNNNQSLFGNTKEIITTNNLYNSYHMNVKIIQDEEGYAIIPLQEER